MSHRTQNNSSSSLWFVPTVGPTSSVSHFVASHRSVNGDLARVQCQLGQGSVEQMVGPQTSLGPRINGLWLLPLCQLK